MAATAMRMIDSCLLTNSCKNRYNPTVCYLFATQTTQETFSALLSRQSDTLLMLPWFHLWLISLSWWFARWVIAKCCSQRDRLAPTATVPLPVLVLRWFVGPVATEVWIHSDFVVDVEKVRCILLHAICGLFDHYLLFEGKKKVTSACLLILYSKAVQTERRSVLVHYSDLAEVTTCLSSCVHVRASVHFQSLGFILMMQKEHW